MRYRRARSPSARRLQPSALGLRSRGFFLSRCGAGADRIGAIARVPGRFAVVFDMRGATPPGVTPCWFPTLSARRSFHACGWVRWFWSSMRCRAAAAQDAPVAPAVETTGVVAQERAGKQSSRLWPRRGLCFATSREAARDTIFDRQRATWRNEPHAVGAQASTVEHQALAVSRGLFSGGGTF
jgi:hypothetical protein